MALFRIVDIYKKLYGEKDGKVGMAMYSLANAKCARGSFGHLSSFIHQLKFSFAKYSSIGS